MDSKRSSVNGSAEDIGVDPVGRARASPPSGRGQGDCSRWVERSRVQDRASPAIRSSAVFSSSRRPFPDAASRAAGQGRRRRDRRDEPLRRRAGTRQTGSRSPSEFGSVLSLNSGSRPLPLSASRGFRCKLTRRRFGVSQSFRAAIHVGVSLSQKRTLTLLGFATPLCSPWPHRPTARSLPPIPQCRFWWTACRERKRQSSPSRLVARRIITLFTIRCLAGAHAVPRPPSLAP